MKMNTNLESCPDVYVFVNGTKVGLVSYTPLRGCNILLCQPLIPQHAPTLQRFQHKGWHLRGLR